MHDGCLEKEKLSRHSCGDWFLRNLLQFVTPSRTYCLYHQSQDELEEWIDVLYEGMQMNQVSAFKLGLSLLANNPPPLFVFVFLFLCLLWLGFTL